MAHWMMMDWILPAHTGKETLGIALRWAHIVAGVTWLGLLYFFVLIGGPFLQQLDADARPRALQTLILPTLNWFRWSALATMFFGLWYWSDIYVAAAAHLAGKNPWSTIGLFVLVWGFAWHTFFALVKRTPNPWVLAVVTVLLIIAAGWVFTTYAPVGRDDNHVLSIGIGGGLGFFMGGNVWSIVWPNYRKLIYGVGGKPPENAAKLQRQIFLAARANFYLSFPMLFFMVAGSHYPLFGR